MTVPELAAFLGITTREIRNWIAEGLIPQPAPARGAYYQRYTVREVEEIEDWYSDCLKRKAHTGEPCEPLTF